MSNLGNLVKQYNRFISDLGILMNDINELISEEFKMEWVYEFWKPRDRAAWASKERFSRWYNKEKTVLYICIDLIDEIPYLLALKTDILNKKWKYTDFGENTVFDSIENFDIVKNKETKLITSFKQDWGDCYYCKIELESINSNQVINSDIKNVLKHLLNMSFNDIKVTKIKFIEN